MTADELARTMPPGTRLYARIIRRSRTGAHADVMVIRIASTDPNARAVNVGPELAEAIGATVNARGDVVLSLTQDPLATLATMTRAEVIAL